MPKNKNKSHTNARKNRNLKNKKNKTKANTNARKNRNLKNTRKKRTRNTKKNTRGGANMNELMEELKQLTELRNRAYNSTGVSGYNANRNERIKVLRRKLGLPTGINLRGNRGRSSTQYKRESGTWRRNMRPAPKPQLPEQELIFVPGSVHKRVGKMNAKTEASKTPKKQNKLPTPTMRLIQEGTRLNNVRIPGRGSSLPEMRNKLSKYYTGAYQQYVQQGKFNRMNRSRKARSSFIIPGTNTQRQNKYSKTHGEGIQFGMPGLLKHRTLPSKVKSIETSFERARPTGNVKPSNIANEQRRRITQFMKFIPLKSKESTKESTKKRNYRPQGQLVFQLEGPKNNEV